MTDNDSSMNGVNASGTGETGETVSHDRCPTAGQDGPSRHSTTARMKWSRDINVAVMERYYLSKPVDDNGRPVREKKTENTCCLEGKRFTKDNRAETM